MRIAGVQMDVKIGDVEGNVARMIDRLGESRRGGAELTIFPECAVPGYCFGSKDEALPFSEPVPGPSTQKMVRACAEMGGFAIFGMLERDGDRLFNAAVLVDGQGVLGSYRKVHLPFLGIDMFTTFGDRPFDVHDAGGIKVGMQICYDASFCEASRTQAILGADLIVLPTNWPPGAECMAASAINTRAMENAVYFAAVNRVGQERGFTFIGLSRICDPSGNTLAASTGTGEEILYADIDPARSRRKHIIRVPGKHEIDRLADRRPEMYGTLVEPHSLKRPGR